MDAMFDSRETRRFEGVDEARQVPERHGLGRCEAFLNLVDRHAGIQAEGLARLGDLIGGADQDVFEIPITVFEGRGFSVDAPGELVNSFIEIEGGSRLADFPRGNDAARHHLLSL